MRAIKMSIGKELVYEVLVMTTGPAFACLGEP